MLQHSLDVAAMLRHCFEVSLDIALVSLLCFDIEKCRDIGAVLFIY